MRQLRQLYRRYIQLHVRAHTHRLLSRLIREYDFWRIHRGPTSLLGPQYRRARRRIEIDITYACNLSCFNRNRSCGQAPTGTHMTVAQIEHFIAESVARGVSWERIRLLGGEPTLHKEFATVLDLLRAYRDRHSPATVIEVNTNGYGEKVRRVLAAIPSDVRIVDTAKDGDLQPSFCSFNVAPADTSTYRRAAYRNGCYIIDECGIGLGPSGYYPCAVASGIDRIVGFDLGRAELPADDDAMEDQLERFCRLCGHFKRRAEPPMTNPMVSPTSNAAYERHRQAPPRLRTYAGSATNPGRR